MNDDMSSQSGDDFIAQNDNHMPQARQPAPVEPPTGSIAVPQDMANAGSDVSNVETDSPESLDEAISQGDPINDESTDLGSPEDIV